MNRKKENGPTLESFYTRIFILITPLIETYPMNHTFIIRGSWPHLATVHPCIRDGKVRISITWRVRCRSTIYTPPGRQAGCTSFGEYLRRKRSKTGFLCLVFYYYLYEARYVRIGTQFKLIHNNTLLLLFYLLLQNSHCLGIQYNFSKNELLMFL